MEGVEETNGVGCQPSNFAPLDVGLALRDPMLTLNAPIVGGGGGGGGGISARVSPVDRRILVITHNSIHILTPSTPFHPMFKAGVDSVFHTQIPREAPQLDDWKNRPFHLDNMLVPSHTFWTRTWRDARWAPDLSYLPSGAPMVAALSNEYQLSVFEPQGDAQNGTWVCRQLLDVSSDGDEVLAELDSQVTAFDWLETPIAISVEAEYSSEQDRSRPLVTGARSGRISFWVWDYSIGQLARLNHHRLLYEPIAHIAIQPRSTGSIVAIATQDRVVLILASLGGDVSSAVTLEVSQVKALALGIDGALVLVRTGEVGVLSIQPGTEQESLRTSEIQWYNLTANWTPTRSTNGASDDPTDTDELAAQAEDRPLAPWSPLAALQPLGSGSWSLALSNGLTYTIPKPSTAGTEQSLDPIGRLVVEPRRGKSSDRQQLALASLQDVETCLITTSSSLAHTSSTPDPTPLRSAFALAARADDPLAPLQLRGVRVRTKLGLATLAPTLTEHQLLEEAKACVYNNSTNGASSLVVAPAHVAASFLLDASTVVPLTTRQGVRQKVLDALYHPASGQPQNVRQALWLGAWLEAHQATPQSASAGLYIAAYKALVTSTQFASPVPESDFAARLHIAQALSSGETVSVTDIPSTPCPACEHDVPFTILPDTKGAQPPSDRTAEGQEDQAKQVEQWQFQSLTALTTGVCTNGHKWRRCSITFKLLTAAHARRCGTCLVHSLLPTDPDLSDAEAKALQRATFCALCGGMWMVE